MRLLGKDLTVRGYKRSEITKDPARPQNAKAFILKEFASSALKSVAARSCEFNEIAEAHYFVEGSEHIGKIFVTT